jgi:glutathione S-transferase/3-isopropylmalate dehydratase
MLTIYHAPRARSNRPVWACEELGVPYAVEILTLGAPKPEVFKKHNPADTIPLMIDGDVVLFESITIMEYIADKHGPTPLAPPVGAPNHWDYRQMLVFGEATLAGPLNAIIGTIFRASPDQHQNFTVDVIRSSFEKRIGVVARQLEKGPYMAGDDFTLADISVGYGVILAQIEAFGLAPLIPESVNDYARRLMGREAYQRMTRVK